MRYCRAQCVVCRANLACLVGWYSACVAMISRLQLKQYTVVIRVF